MRKQRRFPTLTYIPRSPLKTMLLNNIYFHVLQCQFYYTTIFLQLITLYTYQYRIWIQENVG